MSVIKQISVFNGNDWSTGDIGADASNIDISSAILGSSTNVQSALTTIGNKIGTTAIPSALGTTITGAINTLNTNLSNKIGKNLHWTMVWTGSVTVNGIITLSEYYSLLLLNLSNSENSSSVRSILLIPGITNSSIYCSCTYGNNPTWIRLSFSTDGKTITFLASGNANIYIKGISALA